MIKSPYYCDPMILQLQLDVAARSLQPRPPQHPPPPWLLPKVSDASVVASGDGEDDGEKSLVDQEVATPDDSLASTSCPLPGAAGSAAVKHTPEVLPCVAFYPSFDVLSRVAIPDDALSSDDAVSNTSVFSSSTATEDRVPTLMPSPSTPSFSISSEPPVPDHLDDDETPYPDETPAYCPRSDDGDDDDGHSLPLTTLPLTTTVGDEPLNSGCPSDEIPYPDETPCLPDVETPWVAPLKRRRR